MSVTQPAKLAEPQSHNVVIKKALTSTHINLNIIIMLLTNLYDIYNTIHHFCNTLIMSQQGLRSTHNWHNVHTLVLGGPSKSTKVTIKADVYMLFVVLTDNCHLVARRLYIFPNQMIYLCHLPFCVLLCITSSC